MELDTVKVNGSGPSQPLITFPGPGVVKHSPIYGNYVVASRDIAEDELIIQDRPLLVSPYYEPNGTLQICVACHKEVTGGEKCVKCQWPLCADDKCANNRCHTENECDIFAQHEITCSGLMNDYLCVETLRCLLLKRSNPTKWARILEFEGHSPQRAEKEEAKKILDFVSNTVLEKCAFGKEFDAETLNHVVGVLSINTFCGLMTFNSYSSILFDKVTLFAHDCDPNTSRELVMLEENPNKIKGSDVLDCCLQSGIAIEIKATRPIAKGESLTIRYILEEGVKKRRAELLDLFYFDCTCSRCKKELELDNELALEKLSIQDSFEDSDSNIKIQTNGNVVMVKE